MSKPNPPNNRQTQKRGGGYKGSKAWKKGKRGKVEGTCQTEFYDSVGQEPAETGPSSGKRKGGQNKFQQKKPAPETSQPSTDLSMMGPSASKKSKLSMGCPMIGCGNMITREHAFERHVPLIFDEMQELTEEVTRRRLSALRECAQSILGRLNVEELAAYLSRLGLVQPGYTISQPAIESMKAVCQLQGWEVPSEFNFTAPLCPAVLIHWRLMLGICACMPPVESRGLREAYPELGPPILENLPAAFDAHFHLDRTQRRSKRVSVRKTVDSVAPSEEYRVQVTGGIAVFCDPGTFPSENLMDELSAEGFGVAIGMHPKNSHHYGENDWAAFERSLALPGVKALGEVGLDYSADPSCWIAQMCTLDRAVRSLRPEHVLVLHCRPQRGAGLDLLMAQLMFQLKGVVPPQQRIHFHCFSGTTHSVKFWLSEFPNTMFGFVAPMVGENRVCVKELNDNQILLETDSPYFCSGHPYATPALLGLAAEAVGRVRGQEWTRVLQYTDENARRLYNM